MNRPQKSHKLQCRVEVRAILDENTPKFETATQITLRRKFHFPNASNIIPNCNRSYSPHKVQPDKSVPLIPQLFNYRQLIMLTK